jgi:hypothetical protein
MGATLRHHRTMPLEGQSKLQRRNSCRSKRLSSPLVSELLYLEQ